MMKLIVIGFCEYVQKERFHVCSIVHVSECEMMRLVLYRTSDGC